MGMLRERQEQSTAQAFHNLCRLRLFDSEEKGKNLPIRQAPCLVWKSGD